METEPKTIDISTLSINELKALAYDRILIIEKAKIELQQIQNEIMRKENKEQT